MENSTTLSNLKVYYGWAKLNKIRRNPALSVMFENSLDARSERGKKTLSRMQTTFYERRQTIGEAADGAKENRIFTEYSMFLFDKRVRGNLDYLLDQNMAADINNVPESTLFEVRSVLLKGFKHVYKDLKL